MKKTLMALGVIIATLGLLGCGSMDTPSDLSSIESAEEGDKSMTQKVVKSEEEWKKILTPEQYRVLRKAGTEKPFTGKYNDHSEEGIYVCAACGTPLFSSKTKYDHKTGWPSYTSAIDENNIEYRNDFSLGMKRIEVRCAVCGSHLGHVFDDGPPPKHKHFCINSIAMDFKPANQDNEIKKNESSSSKSMATFAAGCFWGVEHKFRQIEGVLSTTVGYTGGLTENPTYKKVCSDTTGHAEAIRIIFNPSRVSYEELLRIFFLIHDPTQINRQGPDVGSQYRSAIFYHDEAQKTAAKKMITDLEKLGKFEKPIATQVLPAKEFYKAEEYHQQYIEKRTRSKDNDKEAGGCAFQYKKKID
jgi:peptide methionine sulfoxide reductase msrA/msrB